MDISIGILNDFLSLAHQYTYKEILCIENSSQYIKSSNKAQIIKFIDYLKIVDDDKFNINLKSKIGSLKASLIRRFLLEKYSNWHRQKIKYGIKDFYESRLTLDEKFCIDDSKLFDIPLTLDNYIWWISLYKNVDDSELLINGYQGELLSIKYEADRLKIPASYLLHKSIINANFGYDIQSFLDSSNLKVTIAIEVKTIRNSNNKIFITRNEMNKSKSMNYYFFHIWKFTKTIADLYVFDKAVIANNYPIEQGIGKIDKIIIDFTEIFKENKPLYSVKIN